MSLEKHRYELEAAYEALEAIRGHLVDLDNVIDDHRDDFIEKGGVTYDESEKFFQDAGKAVIALYGAIDEALKGYIPRRPNPELYYTDRNEFILQSNIANGRERA